MNIYHITYAPDVGTVHLHFWGCNLRCQACLLKKEIYDCHLAETKAGLFKGNRQSPPRPERFLDLEEVCRLLEPLEVKVVIFMGGEAALDPQLPQLAAVLHREFSSYNILLTNGFKVISLEDIDEVVFSLKAHTDSLHRHFTGKSNKQALDNFIGLYQSGIKLRTESIFIPDYIDCPEIEHIACFIARVDRHIPYRIDAYIPVSDNPWRRPTSQEMKEAVSVAQRYLANVSCLAGNETLKFNVLRVY